MDIGDFIRVTMEWTLPSGSNPALNVWDFEVTAATNPFDLTTEGAYIVNAIVSTRYIPLNAYIADAASVTAASVRGWSDPADGYDTAGSLYTGGADSAMLPPFVTTSIEMIRDNFVMRNGRKAIPAPHVAMVDINGQMSSAVVLAIEAVTTDWAENDIVVAGDTSEFTLSARIIRLPTVVATNPTVFSRISGYGNAKFGTQNGRKS